MVKNKSIRASLRISWAGCDEVLVAHFVFSARRREHCKDRNFRFAFDGGYRCKSHVDLCGCGGKKKERNEERYAADPLLARNPKPRLIRTPLGKRRATLLSHGLAAAGADGRRCWALKASPSCASS